jgi:hypothetical protein
MPSPVQLDEILSGLGGQLLRLDGASERNGCPDLLQICRTIRTTTKVSLEPTAISAREGSFEVVSDQFDGLLTHQVFPS